jgi:hypothetical protein
MSSHDKTRSSSSADFQLGPFCFDQVMLLAASGVVGVVSSMDAKEMDNQKKEKQSKNFFLSSERRSYNNCQRTN